MSDDDPYWDDLGIAWRAVNSDSTLVTARLRTQMKRELWRERLGVTVGVVAALCGIAIGYAWLQKPAPGAKWIGAVVITGIAILLALYPWVRVQALSRETAPLMRMIDMSVAQARQRQRDSRAGYVGSVVLVIAGALISYIWRFRLHLPGAQAMLLMAASLVIALVLCLQGHHYARKSRDMQARFEYLRRALSASSE